VKLAWPFCVRECRGNCACECIVEGDRIDGMGDDGTASLVARGLDPATRRVVFAAVAVSAVGWWPAFTLGVYGGIFFEQRLTLWAVATSAFLAVVLAGGRDVWRRLSTYALLLPSFWLLFVWSLPVITESGVQDVILVLEILVTLLGLPALAAFLVRLLIHDPERMPRKQALTASVVVLLVMLASYGLGRQHPHLLSCQDFTVSGNLVPANCTPGISGTGN